MLSMFARLNFSVDERARRFKEGIESGTMAGSFLTNFFLPLFPFFSGRA